eukprot:Opistho-2@46650
MKACVSGVFASQPQWDAGCCCASRTGDELPESGLSWASESIRPRGACVTSAPAPLSCTDRSWSLAVSSACTSCVRTCTIVGSAAEESDDATSAFRRRRYAACAASSSRRSSFSRRSLRRAWSTNALLNFGSSTMFSAVRPDVGCDVNLHCGGARDGSPNTEGADCIAVVADITAAVVAVKFVAETGAMPQSTSAVCASRGRLLSTRCPATDLNKCTIRRSNGPTCEGQKGRRASTVRMHRSPRLFTPRHCTCASFPATNACTLQYGRPGAQWLMHRRPRCGPRVIRAWHVTADFLAFLRALRLLRARDASVCVSSSVWVAGRIVAE